METTNLSDPTTPQTSKPQLEPCPRCGTRDIVVERDGRRRCRSCKHLWGEVRWPPKIGSPQWAYLREQNRVVIQEMKNKLSDDRQYLADPMDRADDRAALQFFENIRKGYELEEELLSNPSPERTLEINAQRAALSATQPDDFSFLQRLGLERNARFERAKRIFAGSYRTSHVGTIPDPEPRSEIASPVSLEADTKETAAGRLQDAFKAKVDPEVERPMAEAPKTTERQFRAAADGKDEMVEACRRPLDLEVIDDALEALTHEASAKSICHWIDERKRLHCEYADQRTQ